MKRCLALFLVLLLSMVVPFSALAAEKVTILYPGDESDAMTAFLNGPLAARLLAELDMTLEVVFLPWDQYWDQKDIMLAANRPIDLYWDGLPDLSAFVNKKQAQPLDALLADFGANLTAVYPESQLAGGKINGIQYGIPSAFSPSSGMFQFVCLRQDLLDAVGMTGISTPEELKQYATLVLDVDPQIKGPADPIFKPLTRYFAEEQVFWIASQNLVVFGEETQAAYSYADISAFEAVARFNHDMYLEGLYADDLTIKYNERDSRMQTGLYVWVEGSLGKDNEIIGAVRATTPEAVLAEYLLAPEKPRYINATGGEVLCVPYSAPNPQGAIKFLNWMYESQDNYLFCLYGIEGEDFIIDENGRLVTLSEAASGEGYFYEWMFRNKNFQVFPEGISDEYIDMYRNWDNDAIPSGMLGFAFDNTGLEDVETACNQVFAQQLAPILYGFTSFDDAYPKAIEALKAAGIDRYVEAVNTQLAAFLAAK